MKLAVLATTLILGASSVALAAPPVTPYAHNAQLDSQGFRGWHNYRRPAWTTLSYGSLSMRGRKVIDVSSTTMFRQLKLEATGSLFIDKVAITYGNGQTQIVDLDKRLSRFDSALTIDLEGRARRIDKVVVYGRGRAMQSSFKLLAI